MNHSSKQQSINQLRRNNRDNKNGGSLVGYKQEIAQTVTGIMRVGFDMSGSTLITDENVACLPDFFKARLHEISGDNGRYIEYARLSMVSGFAMAQILEKYFRDINFVLPMETNDMDWKFLEVFFQLEINDCFPSEKWRSILGEHLGGLDTYVFFESLSAALHYVLLNNSFRN